MVQISFPTSSHPIKQNIKGKYFGPFATISSLDYTLKILQKVFLLRSCEDTIFENRSNIQFNHRTLAYLILFLSLINIYIFKKNRGLFKISNLLLIIVLIQIFFGVVSILFYMPWETALLHQFFALILFSVSIFYRSIIFRSK